MTMSALLSHFGIGAARYVTAAGEIVFAGVTQAANGIYTHSTKGAVTPLVAHSFHGAEDEPTDSAAAPTAWWDDEDEVRRHVVAMQNAFPAFEFVPADDHRAPCWVGEIDSGRGRLTIAVTMRRDRGLPFVSPLKGPRLGLATGRAWIPAPHLFLNGNLCVAGQDDWNPEQHTAATVTGWAAHWLAAYTEWRFSRRWPVAGYHRAAA